MPKTEAAGQYYVAFRARLKTLRTDLGYSQEEMATALGLSKANYQKYEDRSKFPLHKLEPLALVTQTSIEFVVTGRARKAKLTPLRVVSK